MHRRASKSSTRSARSGSTETGPTACNIHWPNLKTGLCGLPVPGGSAKLAPDGEKFEIRVVVHVATMTIPEWFPS